MGLQTGIQWAHHSWNPWRGCSKVSAGCKNCYMFEEQSRYGRNPAEVVRTSTATFNLPIAEGKKRILDGERVFTCSWSDWFHPNADAWRADAWRMIRHRPGVIFIILTKRLGRVADDPKLLPADWGAGYPNVWLGVSLESAAFLHRVDELVATPARVRVISGEPILAPLGVTPDRLRSIDWLILGGESGNGARVADAGRTLGDGTPRNDIVPIIRKNVEQARGTATAVFVKQLGSRWSYSAGYGANGKGGDPAVWPEDLRIREFPAGATP